MSNKRVKTFTALGHATERINVGGSGLIVMIADNVDFVGKLTAQFSSYDLGTWIDDQVFTEPVAFKIKECNEIFFRLICTEYTSGSIKAVIYREFAPAEI